MTSVSRNRSRNPRRCISFGINSDGDCHRSTRGFLSGRPRHSAITAARREGDVGISGEASIFSPHVTWQDIQFGTVLGHGAPRDWDSALAQDLNDLIVAQRFIAVLTLYQIEDGFFHAGVA